MKDKKFIQEWKCFILLAGMLVACFLIVGIKAAIKNSTVLYEAGTYTGHGTGVFGGDISVTITVDKNSIVSVDSIVGDEETPTIGGAYIADGTFASQIMEVQGSAIDGVSGATMTSNGVRDALTDALAQAAVK